MYKNKHQKILARLFDDHANNVIPEWDEGGSPLETCQRAMVKEEFISLITTLLMDFTELLFKEDYSIIPPNEALNLFDENF